jgi:predicted secreted protein
VLPGVAITAYDAAGKSFTGVTNSEGSVTIGGKPGTWRLIISKEGYETVNSYYDVTETHAAATYLQKITKNQENVALTIYVHDGNLTGPQLPGVQVTGQDASGNSFNQLTSSDGSVVINGQPGTWQFTFLKDGYNPVTLNYNVTATQTTAAYLQRIS